MIRIIIDSTADLGNELLSHYRIEMIPLYVLMGEQSYLDGVNISLEDLFRSVQETGQLPKTSAASIGDFVRHFTGLDDIVYIGISSQLSATIKNATIAAETLGKENVYIVDSLNLSTGIGLLALRAAELRDEGMPAREIAEAIKALVPKVRTSFIIETLDYLYKGGRCTALQNLMSSLLSIRPIIAVRPDGTLGVKAKIRGTRRKGLMEMVKDFEEHLDEIDLHRVFITHTGCTADAEFLKSELLSRAQIEEVLITRAGSVIASHCGPDTIGILYMVK